MKNFGQLSKGGAIWTVKMFPHEHSLMYEHMEVGAITGEEMREGYDVDLLIERVWRMPRSVGCLYLEMNLMLVSGKVVKIEASFEGGRSRVLKVDFDRSTFPSGLKGRWVDVVFEKEAVGGKEGKKGSKRAS
jgi:hypothetical protein